MTTATAPVFDLDDTLKSRILHLAERRGASPAQLARDAPAALEREDDERRKPFTARPCGRNGSIWKPACT